MGQHVLEVALTASLVPKFVHMEDQNLSLANNRAHVDYLHPEI